MGAASDFNLIIFLNFFAFKTEKFHFSPKKRARTAKLRVPIDSVGKNTSKYVLWVCGKISFGEAIRHSSRLFIVKKGDKNVSD